MLLLAANLFTGLLYDLEDPDSSYTTPDIAEFFFLHVLCLYETLWVMTNFYPDG